MTNIVTGNKTFFKNVPSVKYEGPESDNPLAFRWYDENKIVAGKTMKEYLRFACAYWHSFCGSGADPFGEPTHLFPWNEKADAVERAKDKADAAFEFITKLGLPYYCFHDVDVVDYTNDVKENEKRLQAITTYLKQKQEASGVKLLWGTANLFSNRKIYEWGRYQSRFSCTGTWRGTGKSSIGCNDCIERGELCFLGWT